MSNKVRVYADTLKEIVGSDEDTLDAMEDLADEIAEAAMENIGTIFARAESALADFEIIVEPGKDSRGYFFIIQTDGGGPISAYLDAKEENEPGAWMSTAVAEVVGIEGLKVNYFG